MDSVLYCKAPQFSKWRGSFFSRWGPCMPVWQLLTLPILAYQEPTLLHNFKKCNFMECSVHFFWDSNQGRRKVWKSGGEVVLGERMCLPLVEIGLTDLPKTGVAKAPPAPPWCQEERTKQNRKPNTYLSIGSQQQGMKLLQLSLSPMI